MPPLNKMKVSELINKLKDLPQDLEVLVPSASEGNNFHIVEGEPAVCKAYIEDRELHVLSSEDAYDYKDNPYFTIRPIVILDINYLPRSF